MIDVEQRALRAFEQQALPRLLRFVQQPRHVRHHRLESFGQRQRLVQRPLKIHRVRAEVFVQHEVVVVEHLAQLGREALAVKQVLQADRAPRDLVLVGGADAAAGRADLAGALGRSRAPGRAPRDAAGSADTPR